MNDIANDIGNYIANNGGNDAVAANWQLPAQAKWHLRPFDELELKLHNGSAGTAIVNMRTTVRWCEQ